MGISRNAGLALTTSLLAHAALLAGLLIGSSSSDVTTGRPIAIAAVMWDEGRLILDDRPSPSARKPEVVSPPLGSAEESQGFVATVAEPTVSTIGVAQGEGPVVVGTGGATSSAPSRSGMGFLQPGVQARRIVFAIDRSLSMGWGAFETARDEIIATLAVLPPDVSFQVICYNRVAEPLRIAGRVDLVAATEENRRETTQLLLAIRPEGATDHASALRRAILLNADTIYLLTDADSLTTQDVLAITRLNQGRACIHAVELRGGSALREDLPLPSLCRLNRGTYRVCDKVRRGDR